MTPKLTKPRKEDLRKIAKHYGVKYKFRKCRNWGTAYYWEDRIAIHEKFKNDYSTALKIMLHEIGHIHCYRNGIWKTWHHNGFPPKKDYPKIRRVALKAERWVDRWAAGELKKWFPNETFIQGYTLPARVKSHREMIKKHYT